MPVAPQSHRGRNPPDSNQTAPNDQLFGPEAPNPFECRDPEENGCELPVHLTVCLRRCCLLFPEEALQQRGDCHHHGDNQLLERDCRSDNELPELTEESGLAGGDTRASSNQCDESVARYFVPFAPLCVCVSCNEVSRFHHFVERRDDLREQRRVCNELHAYDAAPAEESH